MITRPRCLGERSTIAPNQFYAASCFCDWCMCGARFRFKSISIISILSSLTSCATARPSTCFGFACVRAQLCARLRRALLACVMRSLAVFLCAGHCRCGCAARHAALCHSHIIQTCIHGSSADEQRQYIVPCAQARHQASSRLDAGNAYSRGKLNQEQGFCV